MVEYIQGKNGVCERAKDQNVWIILSKYMLLYNKWIQNTWVYQLVCDLCVEKCEE